MKDERVAAAQGARRARSPSSRGDREGVHRRRRAGALRLARSSRYAQGFVLMRRGGQGVRAGTSTTAAIALMWRGGCIIRSAFLGKIKEAFDRNPKLDEPAARPVLPRARSSGARPAGGASSPTAVADGIPMPGVHARRWPTSTATARERLPANLLQAQRDYFGAHTYERVDQPRGQFFHTNWTGRGGTTASSRRTTSDTTRAASPPLLLPDARAVRHERPSGFAGTRHAGPSRAIRSSTTTPTPPASEPLRSEAALRHPEGAR